MKKLVPAIAAIACFAAGCLSSAQRLDPSVVRQVQEGRTSRVEVEQKFGKPAAALMGSNRKTLVKYQYELVVPSGHDTWTDDSPTRLGDIWSRTLSLLYDEHGTVERFLWYETKGSVKRNVGTASMGRLVTEADLAGIRRGTTTETDLRNVLGRPTEKSLTVEGDVVLSWEYRGVGLGIDNRRQHQTLRVYLDGANRVEDFVVIGNAGQPPLAK